jgi:hypothetical protein
MRWAASSCARPLLCMCCPLVESTHCGCGCDDQSSAFQILYATVCPCHVNWQLYHSLFLLWWFQYSVQVPLSETTADSAVRNSIRP